MQYNQQHARVRVGDDGDRIELQNAVWWALLSKDAQMPFEEMANAVSMLQTLVYIAVHSPI